MKIGYQGIEGSNSEEAAKRLAERLEITNANLIPLVSSKNVGDELQSGSIDYGVVAVRNSIGGLVEETREAIKPEEIEILGRETLTIHHCLFVKDDSITKEKIKRISSHPQALLQCKNNILKYIGSVELREIEDTAIGAKYLAEGILDSETGVLCRKNAGQAHNLFLLEENIEDRDDNETEFIIFRKS